MIIRFITEAKAPAKKTEHRKYHIAAQCMMLVASVVVEP